MTEENEANVANYAELQGHIDIVKAKLAQVGPQNQGNYRQLQEDLEDYYERAVQVRAMRVTTLEEQLREHKERLDHVDRSYRLARGQKVWATIVAVVAAVMAAMELLHSGSVAQAFEGVPIRVILTYAVAAVLGAVARPRVWG
jgi:hypothetical protein